MLNDNNSAMIAGVAKPIAGRWITAQELLEDSLEESAEFREAWYAETLARTFGLAVLKYRADRNLSQTALGRIVGMTQPQIARIEDGEHTPSLPTMLRICDTLGLDIDLRIGPREDGKRSIPKALQKGVYDASDQVIVSIRERSVTA
jgi:transcriptional regulator with XRE-family HTH domain